MTSTMSFTRRDFLLGAAALTLAGCRDQTPAISRPATLQPRVLDYREPLAKAATFLAAKQSADGAWRSDLVGTFKDGTALTPLVLLALLHADPKSPSIPKAASWLAGMATPD